MVFKILFGLVALIVGADFLIKSASKVASRFGISPLIIGLTVVAFGTSAPELVVSVKATLSGNADIAVANVVGSNIFNVLFILGTCALVAPLVVSAQLIRIDVPVMMGISLLLALTSWNGFLGRLEGAFLLALSLIYTFLLMRQNRSETNSGGPKKNLLQLSTFSLLTNVLVLLGGLLLLIQGANWFVEGSVLFAKSVGVTDTVIGLTIVAAGTSLPEVATSLLATLKGERDLAIGNVVGSNIFNILLILGFSAMVTPGGIPVSTEFTRLHIPIMVAASFVCLPIFFSGMAISRWEGFLFLLSYGVYIIFLILHAVNHPYLSHFENGVFFVFLPLLTLALIVMFFQIVSLRKRPNRS